MNYIDIFKKGGKIKDKLFEAITHIFQIDNDTASKLYDNALKKYGSDNKIMEALATEIGNDQSQESVQNAMINVFGYDPKENEAPIFKCGGKMQQLAARFGKGGSVGCGCGGMKMDQGGPVSSNVKKLPRTWRTYPDGSTQSRQIAFFPSGDATMQIITDYSKVKPEYRPTKAVRDTVNLGGYVDENGNFYQDGDVSSTGADPLFQPEKFVQLKDDGGLIRAKNYYRNHSDEATIRKIQNFLYSRGYDLGESGIDGKFGKDTYAAIRKYQRDNGLKDDGMWGEDTNSVHRVLNAVNAPYRGEKSGAHAGTHTYTSGYKNTIYGRSGKVTMKQINDVIAKATIDPEWFWGDSDEAKQWRTFFQKGTPDGNGGTNYGAILKDIYRNTPDDIRKTISIDKLPSDLQQAVYNKGITDATTNAAPMVAATLTAPIALTNPLGTAGALIFGKVGGDVGEVIGESVSRRQYNPETGKYDGNYVNQNDEPLQDVTGYTIPLVMPDRSRQGRAVGTAVGTALGGFAGQTLAESIEPNFRANPSGVEQRMSKPELKPAKPTRTGPKREYIWRQIEWRPKPPKIGPDGTYKNTKNGTEWFAKGYPQDNKILETSRSGYFIFDNGGAIKTASDALWKSLNESLSNDISNKQIEHIRKQGFSQKSPTAKPFVPIVRTAPPIAPNSNINNIMKDMLAKQEQREADNYNREAIISDKRDYDAYLLGVNEFLNKLPSYKCGNKIEKAEGGKKVYYTEQHPYGYTYEYILDPENNRELRLMHNKADSSFVDTIYHPKDVWNLDLYDNYKIRKYVNRDGTEVRQRPLFSSFKFSENDPEYMLKQHQYVYGDLDKWSYPKDQKNSFRGYVNEWNSLKNSATPIN